MNLSEEQFNTLLTNAKDGDTLSLVTLLEKYSPLIKKYASTYHIKNYDRDDLLQEGTMAVIHALKKFDLSKNPKTFDAYAIISIRNHFGTLVRTHSRKNSELSLNKPQDGAVTEPMEMLLDDYDIEDSFIKKFTYNELSIHLRSLPNDILKIIHQVYYLKSISLFKYCSQNNLNYYNTRRDIKSTFFDLSSKLCI